MAINLELPKKLQAIVEKGHQGAAELVRPISRKYDLAEHAYPVELETLETLFAGVTAAGTFAFAGAEAFRAEENTAKQNVNGANMSALLNALEMSWGDVGLLLTVPYQGLGNAAVSSVTSKEDGDRFGKIWAAMAITEPGFGSDSAAVSTTAKLDGDEYVINGEKIFVTAGSRATHIVVWATLDKTKGRPAIKSFLVPREHPGVTIERLEAGHQGLRYRRHPLRQRPDPQDYILSDPEINTEKGFGGVMSTFDNTRPIVAAMAVGVSGPRWRSCARSSRTQASRSPMTGRRMPSTRLLPSSCGWRPIGSRRTC